MDPAEVIEQWQAIEGTAQPKLLTDTEDHVGIRDKTSAFGRINVLARKVSQTSRTCRSLEVIVQAHVSCLLYPQQNLGRPLTTPTMSVGAMLRRPCK